MKRGLVVSVLLSVIALGSARAEDLALSQTLVWCGLDYSMVRMIGTTDFREPDKIFPGMLEEWNKQFLKEMIPELEQKLTPAVKTDLKAVQERNEKAMTNQIIREDGTREDFVKPTHITEKDIAAAVHSYELKNTEGIGLVFLMDRLVKKQQIGCMHVVFFDVASRKVLHSERFCGEAGGAGHGYWFKPIKRTLEKLPDMYKKAKTAKAG